MYIKREKTFGEFVDWVCNFSDEELIRQIRIVDEMLDNDIVLESVFSDFVLDLREEMHEEIVRRSEKRLKNGIQVYAQ